MVENKILVNVNVHKKSKISRDAFLSKVKHVKYIRTANNRNFLSFYITSIREHLNLKRFHDLVNKGQFDFDEDYSVFAVGIPIKLFEWFSNNKLAIIERQIINWLAATYFFEDKYQRQIMEDQLYEPLFLEMQEVIKKYYSTYISPISEVIEDEESMFMDEFNAQNKKYIEVSKTLCGQIPPDFLRNHSDFIISPEYGVYGFNFTFTEAYFTQNDWEQIIVKNSTDSLSRSESIESLWKKWKYTFSTYELKKSFAYNFYFEELKPLRSENHKPRREKISSKVRNEVWNRDGGKCVECGSKEKLEFDHIIPFSEGGATSYRNLQLLCEPCNRRKSNKI